MCLANVPVTRYSFENQSRHRHTYLTYRRCAYNENIQDRVTEGSASRLHCSTSSYVLLCINYQSGKASPQLTWLAIPNHVPYMCVAAEGLDSKVIRSLSVRLISSVSPPRCWCYVWMSYANSNRQVYRKQSLTKITNLNYLRIVACSPLNSLALPFVITRERVSTAGATYSHK